MPLTDEQLGAVESIDKHVLVSAGAGSGKTSVLVERYLEVLRRDSAARVNDIVAVTFTRKAAEEMRTRLKEGLKKLSVESPTEQERQRWERCLVEIESSRIGTIHSLCDFILKTHSTDAAVDPGFELLDDLERTSLIEESIRTSIGAVLESPPKGFSELLDLPLDYVKDMLKQLVNSYLKYREASRFFLPEHSGKNGQSNLSLRNKVERMRELGAEFVRRNYINVVSRVINQREFVLNSRYILQNAWPDPDNALAKQQDLVCSLLLRLQDSRGADHEALESLADIYLTRAGGEQGATLRAAIKSVRNAVKAVAGKLSPNLNENDEIAFSAAAALTSLADRTIAEYQQAKQSHQKLDFDDLIARTADLVQNSNRRVSLPSMRALLVDEFQDTNGVQARMLACLAAASAATRLFLIGDDKQSIYKFQGADVGTFNLCKNFIAAQSDDAATRTAGQQIQGWPTLRGEGELRSLSRSFRSHPSIVEFVNVLFHKLFDATSDAESYRSRFQALNAARSGEIESQRVEIITYGEYEEVEQERPAVRSAPVKPSMAQLEAGLVARHILERVKAQATFVCDKDGQARPVRYGDFAILLQANGDFAPIESALADAGIPYISFAGSGYLERQEILDIENLLKWLLSPQDGHALLAALRSPMFGISDDLLHYFKTNTPQSSLWFMLRQTATERQDPGLLRTVALLRDWLRRVGESSVEELVRQIVMHSGVDIVLPAVPGGKQRARNLWKFVNVAAKYNHLGLRGFLTALQAMRDNGVKNLTDAPLTSDDAVKIMTVHKSKGLEFGVVVLPRLSRRVHGQSGKLLFGKEFGIAIDPTRDQDDEKPAFFSAVDSFNRAMDEEEKKRLLYVALTRARDHLVLFLPAKPGNNVSFARWIRDGLDIEDLGEFSEVIEGQASSGGRTTRFLLRFQFADRGDAPYELDSESAIDRGECERTNFGLQELDNRLRVEQQADGVRRFAPGHDAAAIANSDSRTSVHFELAADEERHELVEGHAEQVLPLSDEEELDRLFADVADVSEAAGPVRGSNSYSRTSDRLAHGADAERHKMVEGDTEQVLSLSDEEELDRLFEDVADVSEVADPVLDGLSENASSASTGNSKRAPIDDVNLALIEPFGSGPGDAGAVPWQALVRATPSASAQTVHATVIGSYFHLLMDRLSYTMEMVSRDVMVHLLTHSEVSVYHPVLQQQLLLEGEKLLSIYAASPLKARMVKARRLIHETSWISVRNGEPQQESRPDLLLQDYAGNWSIIDYKTDHIQKSDVAKQAKLHRAQLVGYADDFKRMTGHEPRTFLYFAQLGLLHEVDCQQPAQLRLI